MVSLVVQLVKNLPVMLDTWVRSLGWEDPLEKEKATHSSILAWRIPQTVETTGSQRVGTRPSDFDTHTDKYNGCSGIQWPDTPLASLLLDHSFPPYLLIRNSLSPPYKKAKLCFSAALGGRGCGSALAASVPDAATWWRPWVQNRPGTSPVRPTEEAELGTRHSLGLQAPCFVQVQPGPVLFFRQGKSPYWTAGKYIFKPTISQLVLRGLKPYDWTNSSCTPQSTFNKKGKSCCPLPTAALHFSATEWEYFLPSCSNSHKIHSDFTEVEAYLSWWRKVCCNACWFINSKYLGNTLCKKHYNSKLPIILITFLSY